MFRSFAPSRRVVVATIFTVSGLLLALPTWQTWQSLPPDFTMYPTGAARKEAFFNYLGPIIDRENDLRRERRQRLQDLKKDLANGASWTKRDRLWVEELASFYEVDMHVPEQVLVDTLLVHVDTIPRGLALAQAAKESAWGTSRFAIEGNNYFGQRCYMKGCGMVPVARPPGAKFEVRRFDSVEASVASYMNNINGHREYEALRAYRAERRRLGEVVSSIQAAERITQYSERRQAYVDDIQALIHFNKLDESE